MAEQVLKIGFEKVINTVALQNTDLISDISKKIGSQSLIVAIDVKKSWLGKGAVHEGLSGRWNSGMEPIEWAQHAQSEGAGEILLTSIEREGTWEGFDQSILFPGSLMPFRFR